MRMYDLILKKRGGGELSGEEIRFMVRGYTEGSIPDYQMSSMMMAIFFRGMSERETLALTMEMEHSGDTIDLSGIRGIKVDKHLNGRNLPDPLRDVDVVQVIQHHKRQRSRASDNDKYNVIHAAHHAGNTGQPDYCPET